MTTRPSSAFRVAIFFAFALCCVPLFALATSPTNFSGTFVLLTANPQKASAPTRLKIEQGTKTIIVVDDSAGKLTKNTYQMDGTNGVYTTPTGFEGTGSIKWDDKALVLQSLVAAKKPDNSVIHFLTKKRLELSADGKTLKVHTVIISPDVPSGLFPPFDSVYKRVQ